MWEHIQKEGYTYAWKKIDITKSGVKFIGVQFVNSDTAVLFNMASGFYIYVCEDNMYRKISDCFINRDDAMLFVDNYIEEDINMDIEAGL